MRLPVEARRHGLHCRGAHARMELNVSQPRNLATTVTVESRRGSAHPPDEAVRPEERPAARR
jgi:hypothetical protein